MKNKKKFLSKHLSKNLIISLLVVVIIVMISFNLGLLAKQNLTLSQFNKDLLITTPIPTATHTPTPTLTPTPTPIEVFIAPKPTSTPTPNPVIQDRISQIDKQISSMQKNIQSTLDEVKNIGPCMTTTCSMSVASIYSSIQSSDMQIQQLQAEKTQLQIQLTK